jgi:predicted alpha/beta-hydrolase family hydrolase
LATVKGLVFLGFPLHAAGQPSDERAAHLFDVRVPMLFVQGTRDSLANLALVRPLVRKLGRRAALHVVEDGDHSFHVPARSGRTDPEVRQQFLDATAGWMKRIADLDETAAFKN